MQSRTDTFAQPVNKFPVLRKHKFHRRMQKRLTLVSFLSQINPIHILTFRICTTGPQPLPKEVLHIGKSNASYFNSQYPLVCLRSSGSSLPLLPRLPVTRNILSIFRSVTCFRRQFARKVLPVLLVTPSRPRFI